MQRKRIYSLVLMLAVLFILTGTVTAADGFVNKELYYGNIKITLNGNTVTPQDANGTPVEPFTIDGTTYLPVRSIANALGLGVGWDGATSTVKLTSDAAPTAALSPAALYAQCRQSVVHLETGVSGGTGFFLTEDTVVTNNHVINGAYKITAKTVDGEYLNVTHILAKSENPDLAILKVDGKGTPVKVASSVAAVGTDAYTIGAPLGIFPTFSSGMVMNNTFEENGTSFYLTSIGAISGNSGGPVFNANGEVIGVVQGGMGDGSNTMDMMIQIKHVYEMNLDNPQELTGKEPLPEDDMTKASNLASAQVGDLVSFGTYEQDNDSATTDEEIL